LFKALHHLQAILGKVIQLVTKFSARRAMGAGIYSNQKPPTHPELIGVTLFIPEFITSEET